MTEKRRKTLALVIRAATIVLIVSFGVTAFVVLGRIRPEPAKSDGGRDAMRVPVIAVEPVPMQSKAS